MARKLFVLMLTFLCILTVRLYADFQAGPSGGTGGGTFQDVAPRGSRIVEVRVRAGARIDAIQMVYETSDGRRTETPWRGGTGGGLETLKLGRGEYINGIRGKYGARIDSLTFLVEGKRDWTGFHVGGDGGVVDFRYDAPSGFEVVGFKGRSGAGLDAIGLVLRER